MNILGLHACFTAQSHDPSAALLMDGRTIAATEEERLNRIKTSVGFFPYKSVEACLEIGRIKLRDIDRVAADGVSFPYLREKIAKCLKHKFGFCPPIHLVHHAKAHVAGAFLSSGFEKSLVVSVDGLGDRVSSLVEVAERKRGIAKFRELYRADKTVSLGNFYTAFTNYLGFKSVEGEYKVMGMAAYGKPRFNLSRWLRFDPASGQIVRKTPKAYNDFRIYTSVHEAIYNEKEIFRATRVRRPLPGFGGFRQEHFDLAASVQQVFQEAYLGLIQHYLKKEGLRTLCLAGGCALNCLANMKLLHDPDLNVYIMPAASDRGLSLGAAMAVANQAGECVFPVTHQYLGRGYTNGQIKQVLKMSGLPYKRVKDQAKDCAGELARGRVVAWFQGRAEFGPRALGHRSILANPRIRNMKIILNAKIKFRESYRPFAPAMLPEESQVITRNRSDLGYMTFTLKVPSKLAKRYPEAVHFDGTTRVQSVNRKNSPLFHRLLCFLRKVSGVGAVINTSFNLANEPIVDSPLDAIRSFISSGIDVLYLHQFKLSKKNPIPSRTVVVPRHRWEGRRGHHL